MEQFGSLILFKKSRLPIVAKVIQNASMIGLDAEIISKKEAASKIPLLVDADFDQAVWTATDGVVDIHNFLWSYIKDATQNGARLKTRHRVLAIEKLNDGSFKVTTEKGFFQSKYIVNAAGAWAGIVGQMAGAMDIKLTPFRRHLYNTTPMEGVDSKWPFVWDVDNEYYFRPESGGLLLGPCDEEEVPPGVPSTSHLVREMLADKLSQFCPRLANVVIATEWAGLRTFADDRRFVIGEDSVLEGFFWCAALGGYGVSCSYEIGRLTADAILNKGKNISDEFRPDRFLKI